MQTELSFIIFMMLLFATAVIFLWMMTRSKKKKQCKNCRFFTLRKESKRLGNCSRFFEHHFFWEPACKGWERKPDHDRNHTVSQL